MRGKFRRHFFLDLLHRRVRVAGVQVREGAFGAIKQAAGAFQSDNGVIERRFLGIVGDGADFLELLAHASHDRRGEMFVLDFIERRNSIRKRALRKQRVIGCRGARLGCGHGGDLRAEKEGASSEKVKMSHKDLWLSENLQRPTLNVQL